MQESSLNVRHRSLFNSVWDPQGILMRTHELGTSGTICCPHFPSSSGSLRWYPAVRGLCRWAPRWADSKARPLPKMLASLCQGRFPVAAEPTGYADLPQASRYPQERETDIPEF